MAIAERPRLRGYFHLAAAMVAPLGLVWLVLRANSPAEDATAAVFGAGMITLFVASSAYHIPPWPPKGKGIARRLDHAAIFFFVAAAYTPFCMVALPLTWGIPLLATVGSLALVGAVVKVCWPGTPPLINLAMYLAVGWAALVAAPVIALELGAYGMLMLVGAGLAFSAGGVIHAQGRPNPLPRWFGHHEIFHAATVVGTVMLFVVVDGWVFGSQAG
ncbi:MAG: hemolysin III family protein [Dehalococcoidia bacterium]|nr:hemolysin III family protein [Dehalococcoidia bacterium]